MSNASTLRVKSFSLHRKTVGRLSGPPTTGFMDASTFSGSCGWTACTESSCSEVGYTNSCCTLNCSTTEIAGI